MLDEPLRRRVVERTARPGRGRLVPAPPSAHRRPRAIAARPTELLALLAQFDGNVSLLAKHVGRNRKQVYRWMDDLGVSRGTGRG